MRLSWLVKFVVLFFQFCFYQASILFFIDGLPYILPCTYLFQQKRCKYQTLMSYRILFLLLSLKTLGTFMFRFLKTYIIRITNIGFHFWAIMSLVVVKNYSIFVRFQIFSCLK